MDRIKVMLYSEGHGQSIYQLTSCQGNLKSSMYMSYLVDEL